MELSENKPITEDISIAVRNKYVRIDFLIAAPVIIKVMIVSTITE